jgi:hypothetical protein
MILTGETLILEEKMFPVPIFQPQILHGEAKDLPPEPWQGLLNGWQVSLVFRKWPDTGYIHGGISVAFLSPSKQIYRFFVLGVPYERPIALSKASSPQNEI